MFVEYPKSMILSGSLSLAEIASAFNEYFPSLRLVFFRILPSEGAPRSVNLNDQQAVLCTVGNCDKNATLKIDRKVRIAAFEEQFFQTFGVGVRVTRQSGNEDFDTRETPMVE